MWFRFIKNRVKLQKPLQLFSSLSISSRAENSYVGLEILDQEIGVKISSTGCFNGLD